MDKKYKFTGEEKTVNGVVLKRIVATKCFNRIGIGDIGGWIEKEENLSQEGNSWVYKNAEVWGNARIYDNAQVKGRSKVYGDAWVSGDVYIEDNAEIFDNSWVCDNAWVYDNAKVYGNAYVRDNVHVHNDALIGGNTHLRDGASVCGDALVEKTRDVILFPRVGSRNDILTAFRTKNGFKIKIGCFLGDLKTFLKQVKEKHGDNKYAEEYRAIAEVLKIRFKK